MSKYCREKYYAKFPNRTRYAIAYRCTLTDGTVKEFDNIKDLAKYVGYAVGTVKKVLEGKSRNKLFTLERLYN